MGICNFLCSSYFGDFFLWLCRLWGLATAVGTWGVGVETAYYGHYLGYYLLALASLITFLEVVFAATYCVELCISADSSCRTCWSAVVWLDDWKKGVFYFCLSIPCFVQPTDVWLAIIAGTLLIFCGILYTLKTFKTNVDRQRLKLATKPSYDKFDELQDDVDLDEDDDDDHVIDNPGTISIMENDISDQTEILEV